MDKDILFLVLGIGEVIELDDGILVIGFGGNYVLVVGWVFKRYNGG